MASKSSAEAEHWAVANVVAKSCWVCNFLLELYRPVSTATVVYCDNSTCLLIRFIIDGQKHIEIGIYFVQEKVAIGVVRVLYVPSSSQYADIVTKGLSSQLFAEFRIR